MSDKDDEMKEYSYCKMPRPNSQRTLKNFQYDNTKTSAPQNHDRLNTISERSKRTGRGKDCPTEQYAISFSGRGNEDT